MSSSIGTITLRRARSACSPGQLVAKAARTFERSMALLTLLLLLAALAFFIFSRLCCLVFDATLDLRLTLLALDDVLLLASNLLFLLFLLPVWYGSR